MLSRDVCPSVIMSKWLNILSNCFHLLTLTFGLQVTEGVKVIENGKIRKLGTVSYTLRPCVVTLGLSYIITEIKRDIGRQLQFFHTPCIPRPRWGVGVLPILPYRLLILFITVIWLWLLSRRSRQRKRLHATGLSICSFLCLSVCLSVAKIQ